MSTKTMYIPQLKISYCSKTLIIVSQCTVTTNLQFVKITVSLKHTKAKHNKMRYAYIYYVPDSVLGNKVQLSLNSLEANILEGEIATNAFH